MKKLSSYLHDAYEMVASRGLGTTIVQYGEYRWLELGESATKQLAEGPQDRRLKPSGQLLTPSRMQLKLNPS